MLHLQKQPFSNLGLIIPKIASGLCLQHTVKPVLMSTSEQRPPTSQQRPARIPNPAKMTTKFLAIL